MTDFSNMTNEELEHEYVQAWHQYMYYQAAEGNWNKETEARGVATKEYMDLREEMKARGLPTE